MSQLDRIDHEILAALQKNGRLPNRELAERVGLAPSTVLARVRRLAEDRVLRSFHAEVDPGALGIGLQALIAVRLSRHNRDAVEAFREHALSRPEVVALYHTAGAEDFLVHVAVRDAEHLREVAMSAFTTRPEVAHLQTSLLFEQVRKAVWPAYPEVEEE